MLLQSHLHPRVLVVHFRILPQQFLRLFRNHFRQRHLHFDKLIAARARVAQRRRATLTQAKLLTRLRARRNAQLRLAFNRRHFNLRSQRAFRHGDRNRDVDVVALAREIFMRADVGDDVQIARRRAESPALPLPGMRTREPVSTPAGMRTLTVSVFGTVPLPLHNEHGERRRPVPPQSGHSCANRKRPPARCTCPEPLQVAQTITGPPISPAPLQREHCSERLTVRLVVKPLIALQTRAPAASRCPRPSSVAAEAAPVPLRAAAKKISKDVAETRTTAAAPPGVEVVPQSKPLKSKPGAVRPARAWTCAARGSIGKIVGILTKPIVNFALLRIGKHVVRFSG